VHIDSVDSLSRIDDSLSRIDDSLSRIDDSLSLEESKSFSCLPQACC
jgi:hypothetical protein